MGMKPIKLAEIEKIGDKLIVPEKLEYREAADMLYRKSDEDEQIIGVGAVIESFVWDGALAMVKAMEKLFGYCIAVPTPGFFGDSPPQMITVETGHKTSVQVPWGTFKISQFGKDGYIGTGTHMTDGRMVFSLGGEMRRKYQPLFNQLVDEIKAIVKTESIYRGKAFRVEFRSDNGKPIQMIHPKFLDLSKVESEGLIFAEDVKAAIETNLFTPIKYSQECRNHKIPLKRGILLAGPYGCGKTLTAYHTAKHCEDNGWTFVYIRKASELPEALNFIKTYSPAVVFCEDIDTVTNGDRDQHLNDILNTLDGVDSKAVEIITVLTTNHLEQITRAMLRPGRMDALIHVHAPDAEAVQKLLRLYGRGLIPLEADLSRVGAELEGEIPAVIGECVEKAKLAAIGRGNATTSGNKYKLSLTVDDLYHAAIGMRGQREALRMKAQQPKTEAEQFGAAFGSTLVGALENIGSNAIRSRLLRHVSQDSPNDKPLYALEGRDNN